MKRSVKFLGLIALIAIFGFSMIGCEIGELATAPLEVEDFDGVWIQYISHPVADMRILLVVDDGDVEIWSGAYMGSLLGWQYTKDSDETLTLTGDTIQVSTIMPSPETFKLTGGVLTIGTDKTTQYYGPWNKQ